MRKTVVTVAALVLSGGMASADPISVDGAFRTSGVFTCLRDVACSGTGTNTVVLGSGSNLATLTFTGVDVSTTFTNIASSVPIGTFESSAPEGFTFPTRPNPNIPILRFNLTVEQTEPFGGSWTRTWGFGPGGRTTLPFMVGGIYVAFWSFQEPIVPGYSYNGIAYTFSPSVFSIPANGAVNLTADVGIVPEPATLLLAGSGLVAAFVRRRRQAPDTRPT